MSVITGKIVRELCVYKQPYFFFFRFKLYKFRLVKKNSYIMLQEQGCITVSVKKRFY